MPVSAPDNPDFAYTRHILFLTPRIAPLGPMGRFFSRILKSEKLSLGLEIGGMPWGWAPMDLSLMRVWMILDGLKHR
jgi:hypothetical protein